MRLWYCWILRLNKTSPLCTALSSTEGKSRAVAV